MQLSKNIDACTTSCPAHLLRREPARLAQLLLPRVLDQPGHEGPVLYDGLPLGQVQLQVLDGGGCRERRGRGRRGVSRAEADIASHSYASNTVHTPRQQARILEHAVQLTHHLSPPLAYETHTNMTSTARLPPPLCGVSLASSTTVFSDRKSVV